MTGTPGAVERQSAPTPQRLNKLSEIRVREAIQQRARELADQGPAFTAEQMILPVFSHRGDGGR